MQPIAEPSTFAGAWRGGWGRFFKAMRRQPRRVGRPAAAVRPAPAIDPVALTIIAVNRLGPATIRAVSLGVPVTVAAPDRATVEIFRAALRQMEKARPTDRLVSVELATVAAPKPERGRCDR